ncbi:MAG: methionine adenosyltransferase [Deltaproteobacteria bacterium RIFCSPLOWO2_02_56_12]|nr:MAG: methionine adenosyltransferase [Deltaproteobacteria bacterium GWD2_55_8]OGP98387.1 MAG: methionine adenosyltransferase [Deltaproteobacteria bacterium RBG_16_55_12]OGQ48947.1 MAG: methionine adenosyltransferase [Deltaproteobacteria bacterium RIFCSPLOWO2_02_56_12]
MAAKDFLFTSESVSEGHPDKMCDQISDAILDAHLSGDPDSRVACEALTKTGMIVIAGEITSKTKVSYNEIARDVVRDIGYTDSSIGFDGNTCAILTAVEQQSPDISQGVTEGEGLHKEQGAGDQGMMFGYACDETPELMPFPIQMAHSLVKYLAKIRKGGEASFIRPDSKSQVTVQYREGRPVRVQSVVVSTQHAPDVQYSKLRETVIDGVIRAVIPADYLDKSTVFHVNPTGRFVVGGPQGDCGLTGRKIIVDTYGGMGRHGGGAFSGKDPSKVDRSAAYMARYIAKNIVAAKLARRCEVQLAYVIGVAQPVSVAVDTFDTGVIPEAELARIVQESFDLRPKAIIEILDLKRPIYRATASYGHFGRTAENGYFTWERTDRVEDLKKAATKV